MKEISCRFYKGEQSWYYERIVKTEAGAKLRVQIRRNAYDQQSFLRGYGFDPNQMKSSKGHQP